jgi:predicted dehydrogenase
MADRKVVRLAVIGMGAMGSRHAQISQQIPGLELAAVADIKPEVVERVSKQLGVPGFVDYQEMLSQVPLDAVTVATSDQFHVEPSQAAAAKGLHLFLEKPIATTVQDGQSIIDAARRHGVKLMVGHTLRYDPRYKAIQQAVSAGKLGEVVHAYARRNATTWSGRRLQGRAETMIFQGIHDIDALQWILGSRITRVYAEGVSKVLTDLGISDAIVATLRFANGAVALLEQSWALPYGVPTLVDAQLEVVGSQGAAYIDARAPSFALFVDGKYSQPDIILHLPEQYYLRDEYAAFVAFIAGTGEPIVSGDVALDALRVAHAVLQSMRSGKPVEL